MTRRFIWVLSTGVLAPAIATLASIARAIMAVIRVGLSDFIISKRILKESIRRLEFVHFLPIIFTEIMVQLPRFSEM